MGKRTEVIRKIERLAVRETLRTLRSRDRARQVEADTLRIRRALQGRSDMADHLDSLGLHRRITNRLLLEGVVTVGDLLVLTRSEVLLFRNIGRRAIAELTRKLSDRGITAANTDCFFLSEAYE